MAFRLPPLTLDEAPHTIGSGQVLVRMPGDEYYSRQGNVRNCSYELTSEEIEERDRQSGTRGVQKKYQIDRGGTISLGLLQETAFGRQVATMSDEGMLPDQQAGVAKSVTYLVSMIGGTYFCAELVDGRLQRRRVVSNVLVTDSTGDVDYVLGTHYVVNAATGAVTILAKPASPGTGLKIVYGCAAVTDRPVYKMWSAAQIECDVMIIQDNFVGTSYEYTFPRVEFKKTGEHSIVSENNELQVNELEGTIYIDGSQEAGYELGYATPIAA